MTHAGVQADGRGGDERGGLHGGQEFHDLSPAVAVQGVRAFLLTTRGLDLVQGVAVEDIELDCPFAGGLEEAVGLSDHGCRQSASPEVCLPRLYVEGVEVTELDVREVLADPPSGLEIVPHGRWLYHTSGLELCDILVNIVGGEHVGLGDARNSCGGSTLHLTAPLVHDTTDGGLGLLGAPRFLDLEALAYLLSDHAPLLLHGARVDTCGLLDEIGIRDFVTQDSLEPNICRSVSIDLTALFDLQLRVSFAHSHPSL